MIFVIDASGSIRENRFEIVTDFVRNAVDALEVAPDRVRVGVITYSDNAYIQFNLNTYTRKDDVLQVRNVVDVFDVVITS